jgi:hypothetical protein
LASRKSFTPKISCHSTIPWPDPSSGATMVTVDVPPSGAVEVSVRVVDMAGW